MINRLKKFCGLLIPHRCHQLPIDVIDYSLMLLITHWLPNDYSSITHWSLIFYHVAQLLQLISNFQYFSLLYLSSHKSSSWTVPDDNNNYWQRRVVNTGESMPEKFVAYRLVIDCPLIISNDQWLTNWLPIDYPLIIHWCHCHRLDIPGDVQKPARYKVTDDDLNNYARRGYYAF